MLNPLSVLIKLPVLLCFYFTSSLASAQIFSSAATSATGGAGRAAVEPNDVNYLNPAGLVHLKGRYIYSTFSKEDLSVGLSETDRSVILPASFSYRQSRYEDRLNRTIEVKESRLSIADFIVEKASIGLTGNMNSTKIDDRSYGQTNGNIGLFYTPTQSFGLGYVFYNVFGPRENIPTEIQLQAQMGFGLNYVFREFLRYRFDVLSAPNNDFGHSTYSTGFETFVNPWILARLGYQIDVLTSQELFTQGLGFRGPVFSVNYAHQGSAKGPDFDRHSIDLLISF